VSGSQTGIIMNIKDIKLNNSNDFIKTGEISTDRFSSWLARTRQAQKNGEAVDVPCGDCTACCNSSYFIHIKSVETVTMAKIPGELMFPAPGMPKGNVLLGYDKKGRCPMFINSKCSIYDYRPETCRTYDCRIFTATGLLPGDDKALISRQAGRWKFKFDSNDDLRALSALRAAVQFITSYAGLFPAGFIPGNTPQQAMVAIKVYEVFLDMAGENETGMYLNPDKKIIKSVMDIYQRFERDKNS